MQSVSAGSMGGVPVRTISKKCQSVRRKAEKLSLISCELRFSLPQMSTWNVSGTSPRASTWKRVPSLMVIASDACPAGTGATETGVDGTTLLTASSR
jgi:hypothetical protein